MFPCLARGSCFANRVAIARSNYYRLTELENAIWRNVINKAESDEEMWSVRRLHIGLQLRAVIIFWDMTKQRKQQDIRMTF